MTHKHLRSWEIEEEDGKEEVIEEVSKETPENEVLERFKKDNSGEGIRVFVAGGSRSGNDAVYAEEAYNLGKKIIKMNFKLDFGLSNSGIMGAVARGVLDGWNEREHELKEVPIQGITTKKYFDLYSSDEDLISKMEVVVTRTLEERKRKLLKADYVVFAPGGVGTLDELAYDCVAMQDGMLPIKPFIIYNINGFFHHLLEYLKFIAHEGFAYPVPFIVVDNAEELEIAFHLLKKRYHKDWDGTEAYYQARKLIYELPYFIKQKTINGIDVESCYDQIMAVKEKGVNDEIQSLQGEIEAAYLEREIEKMYSRLVQTGKDTGEVSDKLSKLKKRNKEKKV